MSVYDNYCTAFLPWVTSVSLPHHTTEYNYYNADHDAYTLTVVSIKHQTSNIKHQASTTTSYNHPRPLTLTLSGFCTSQAGEKERPNAEACLEGREDGDANGGGTKVDSSGLAKAALEHPAGFAPRLSAGPGGELAGAETVGGDSEGFAGGMLGECSSACPGRVGSCG